jgi:transposase
VSTPAQPMMPTPTDTAIIAQLQQQLKAKEQQLRQLAATERALKLAELKIQVLEERLRQELIAKYGKRSETLSDLQLELLDLEPGVSSEEIEAESQREPITAAPAETESGSEEKPADKPRRKHPGRQTLPAHLERVEEIVACSAEDCKCGGCGQTTEVIGYEETEVLDVRPAEYFVHVIKREKRACKGCEEQGVRTATAAERIAPKSLLSDNVIVDLVVNKYCEATPLYRQQAVLKRDARVEVALSTLDDAVMRVGSCSFRLRRR